MNMKKVPSRDTIDEKYKWKLEDIYQNEQLWEKDFNDVRAKLAKIEKYRGKINSSQNLLAVLNLRDEIGQCVDKLFTYARMRRDEDNTRSAYQALADKAMSLAVESSGSLSFIEPEILSLSKDDLSGFLKHNEELKLYAHYIEDLLRMKGHILNADGEKMLADAGEMAQAPGDIFRMLDNADMRFPIIKDTDGRDVELTKGRYIGFMESSDRKVRKAAFEGMHNTYGKFINTLASSFSANVKGNIFYKKQRKFDSCLEASLFSDNIPVKVYDNLIQTVNDRLDLMHRYVRLRKRLWDLRIYICMTFMFRLSEDVTGDIV